MIYYRAQHAFDMKQVYTLEAATNRQEDRNGVEDALKQTQISSIQMTEKGKKPSGDNHLYKYPSRPQETKCLILISRMVEWLKLQKISMQSLRNNDTTYIS